jgi:hypothetical protein
MYELTQAKLLKFIDTAEAGRRSDVPKAHHRIIMISNSVLKRLASWCPWLLSQLRDESKLKQPVKVLVTGAAGMRFRAHRSTTLLYQSSETLKNIHLASQNTLGSVCTLQGRSGTPSSP